MTRNLKWADLDKDGARNPSVKFSFSQTAFCHHSSVCAYVPARHGEGFNQIAKIFTTSSLVAAGNIPSS